VCALAETLAKLETRSSQLQFRHFILRQSFNQFLHFALGFNPVSGVRLVRASAPLVPAYGVKYRRFRRESLAESQAWVPGPRSQVPGPRSQVPGPRSLGSGLEWSPEGTSGCKASHRAQISGGVGAGDSSTLSYLLSLSLSCTQSMCFLSICSLSTRFAFSRHKTLNRS